MSRVLLTHEIMCRLAKFSSFMFQFFSMFTQGSSSTVTLQPFQQPNQAHKVDGFAFIFVENFNHSKEQQFVNNSRVTSKHLKFTKKRIGKLKYPELNA